MVSTHQKGIDKPIDLTAFVLKCSSEEGKRKDQSEQVSWSVSVVAGQSIGKSLPPPPARKKKQKKLELGLGSRLAAKK